MGIQEIQDRIDAILKEYKQPYWSQLSQFARLSEEVGEVGRVLNHKYGDKPKKDTDEDDDLADELADVFWAIICLANSNNISLENSIEKAIQKLQVRDKDRFEKI